VRFEELEADPLRTLRALYADLGLAFDQEHEARVRAFLDELRGYRKNTYTLNPEVESLIRERLGERAGVGRPSLTAAGRVS
jgi:hypothetical protein